MTLISHLSKRSRGNSDCFPKVTQLAGGVPGVKSRKWASETQFLSFCANNNLVRHTMYVADPMPPNHFQRISRWIKSISYVNMAEKKRKEIFVF